MIFSQGLSKFAKYGMPLFIDEAGVNHNGDLETAKALIKAAATAKVDAVKFQTWVPGEITGRFTGKVRYLEETTNGEESRYELSARLALPYEHHFPLKQQATKLGIEFLSTPDGFQSLDFLVDQVQIPLIKVGSTEVTHLQFLSAVGRKKLPVVLSTGLSTLGEVEKALRTLQSSGADDITLLHCTSEYPAPDIELNLRAIETLHQAFGTPVGLSDHSRGPEAAIAAVALGASVIEKHFTLSKQSAGPDHQASMDAHELSDLVVSLSRLTNMLGDGVKMPTVSEIANKEGIRRSVVAAQKIPAGTRLTKDLLTSKRPGGHIEPEHLEICVGFILNRDLDEDEPLSWDDLR